MTRTADPPRTDPHHERGAFTIHTVVLTLTVLGLLGVVVIGVAIAISGFTKGAFILLALFGVQGFYGWVLYRRIPRPDIASLQYEPADEPVEPADGPTEPTEAD